MEKTNYSKKSKALLIRLKNYSNINDDIFEDEENIMLLKMLHQKMNKFLYNEKTPKLNFNEDK